MSYISEIFERANIQQIRGFLLNGVELLKLTNIPYEQLVNESMEKTIKMIGTHFPENNEQMEKHLINAISACKDVYMEIGLQVGILIAMQLYDFKT